MALVSQIRGMALEEVALYLLSNAGYSPVANEGGDPTLHTGKSGLEVKGRGWQHQIDAIADYSFQAPFTNAARLLLEAKFQAERVGLEIIRNAVGVLKDLNEYWLPHAEGSFRYHYQYALLSASGYTGPAEAYAFAHDIFLIPVSDSGCLRAVVEAIWNVHAADALVRTDAPMLEEEDWDDLGLIPDSKDAEDDADRSLKIEMSVLRNYVRENLHGRVAQRPSTEKGESISGLEQVVHSARKLRFGLITMLGGFLPVLLIPSPKIFVEQTIPTEYEVEIVWKPDEQSFYLQDRGSKRALFSFDLPRQPFLDASQIRDSVPSWFRRKLSESTELKAFLFGPSGISIITFRLEPNWEDKLIAEVTRAEVGAS